MPELDVVPDAFRFKADRLADDERHGFGLCFADLFGGQGTAVAAMQHFVSDLCLVSKTPRRAASRKAV